MDNGVIKPMKEGFCTDSMEVGISVDSIKVTSHLLHQIHLSIQGKHQKYLQNKFEWDHHTWDSINWKGLKCSFLPLGPLKQIKTPMSMHGWLAEYWPSEIEDLPRCN
jgi:hypothetical protein